MPGSAEFNPTERQYLISSIVLAHGLGTGAYGFSWWWKPLEIFGAGLIAFGTGQGGGGAGLERPGSLFVDLLGSGGVPLWAPDQDSGFDVNGDSAMSVNSWYFLFARRDSGGVVNLFVNGVKQTDTSTTSYDLPEKKAMVGRGPAGFDVGDGTVHGRLTDICAFDTALSDATILQIYNLRRPMYEIAVSGNKPFYWKLNNTGGLITNGDAGLKNFGTTGVGQTTGELVVGDGSPIWSPDSPFSDSSNPAWRANAARTSMFRANHYRPYEFNRGLIEI